MRIKDLITVCLQNLSRHKARTMLTVLGVIIGCCSVVIMISIGIGMKQAQESALAQMGDLTIITVYPTGKNANSSGINTQAIGKMKQIKGVEAVSPKLTAQNVTVTLYEGQNNRYRTTYAEIVGIDLKEAETMGYKLTEGSFEQWKPGKIFAGQDFAYSFEDTKRPEGRNTIDMYGGEFDANGMPVKPAPYFEPMKAEITAELSDGGEDDKKVTKKFETAGVMKEDYGKGMETSMGLIMSLGDLQDLLDQQARLSGKKVKRKKGYSSAMVKVKDIKDVAGAEKQIKALGFRTSSMESIRKPMEREARQKQMMFAGIGAVSLFVAALGITNTMIMSISERTKEIGVMKSLGCFVKDIRKIFLLEAGCIGFAGGVAGVILSYGVSIIMNLAAGRASSSAFSDMGGDMMSPAGGLSVIPWWLSAFAILFSVLIGVGAGYYPASKAVQIPALEAIKHD